ncbi:hypothetical protein P153DRAFT_317645 [Dothidotthia symphoricarpi CBS 119687]|uniref:Cohesin loading factor-domain-containing protein n=1 Tax=Dothidotthia symphoricarpi CBS 119687 TaxID=1392245 RepID=A0A6A6ADP9_9PLEO|nr:uncharacterized protein P153DRAFT_317645 [Dothidotthia symphoricarpi CBS 119687]KAF2129068.1 hypothetical protein P153DRAFT_317645 [Dothidotthia symphoricarpi CBS 119687]
MDPRYNWTPPAYANSQYVPYTPPQQQQPQQHLQQHQQQQQQQPHGYQQHGYPAQYPPIQMAMPQQYPQLPPPRSGPQVAVTPRQLSQNQGQQYPLMALPMQHPQSQPRAHPQVRIPVRPPGPESHMQTPPQNPRIRYEQVSVQRLANGRVAQIDGAHDRRPMYSTQQVPAPPATKPVQSPSQSHQENGPRPQQRVVSTPLQNHRQNRAPLQPQYTPQQRTPSNQHSSPSIQSASSQPRSHPKVVISSRPPSHQLTSPTKHARPPQKALPADLSVMLLSAADEYIAAARAMGSVVVRDRKEVDQRQYYKLMATAMGCMEAVLKKFNLSPRDEARLRLRYASLLIEETDNTAEIDDALSKGISLCGRCRLQDLKYGMLHLQARYQSKTNHRAALKSLDIPISEAETFQHIAWVYAFRFLKVSLILQIPGRIEAVPALQHLHAISAHAGKNGDRAIYVACSAFEAMVHLRSGAPDRLEHAQRAIAAARSLQLQVSSTQLGSFGTLIDIIDVACGVQQGIPNGKKSIALIEAMATHNDETPSKANGHFTVLIERSFGGSLTMDTGGVFHKSGDGRDELVFTWLPTEDLKTLCLHISALDQSVHERGLVYIKEAHARSREASKRQTSQSLPISRVLDRVSWCRTLDWHSVFTLGLIACYREDHQTAEEARATLKKRATRPPFANDDAYTRTLSYLSAVIDQRSGRFDSASTIYSSNLFTLPEKGALATSKSDIEVLAAVNRLLLIRNSTHPEHYLTGVLLAQLQPLCETLLNRFVRMAIQLANAMSSPNASINRQKTLMQNAVNEANGVFQSTHNREFVIMALCYFTKRFFADNVGEKGLQAVRASRQNANKTHKPLWIAVANGLCIGTFERNGMMNEAQECQRTYEMIRGKLPLALQNQDDMDAEGDEDAEGSIDELV